MPRPNTISGNMRERQHTFRRNIRFRHWIRKAYAAFASIGVCVSIGQLRKNVTERALCKQQTPITSVTTDSPAKDIPQRETDTAPAPDVWQELLIQLHPFQRTIVCQSGKAGHLNKKFYTSPTHLGGVEPRPYRHSMTCRGGALLRPKCYNNPQPL